MYVRLEGRDLRDVKLRLYEPPRFFEAFLRGRAFTEAPDITARICGICPVAYQMSAVRAMEDACGVHRRRPDPRPAPADLLRRVDREPQPARLHAARARLPRLPGRDRDGGRLPRDRRAGPADEEGGQRADRAGRRARDPSGQRRVGGFFARRPGPNCARSDPLDRARETALATVAWAATLAVPDVDLEPEHVALRDPAALPDGPGRIVSDRGLDIAPSSSTTTRRRARGAFDRAARTASRARGYLTGPARAVSLASDALRRLARDAARRRSRPTCHNPFQSIVVRAVELVQRR